VDKNLLPREEEIKSKTRDAVLRYFNTQNFDFEDPFILTDFTRDIFTKVDDVRFAEVDNVDTNIHIEFNEVIQLNNVVINVKGI